MKLRQAVALVVTGFLFTTFTQAACGINPGNPVPNPNPDHGPDISLEDCVAPYFVMEVAILPAGNEGGDVGYARRILHIAVVGTDQDGNPVEFTDMTTGERRVFAWNKDTVTETLRPYAVCVEYGLTMAPYFDFGIVAVGTKVGDWIRMEVWSSLDPAQRNLCVGQGGLEDYAQVTVQEGDGNTAAVNCIVKGSGF
jgi:hypothetical protein